jgi:hypothetical protein
MSDRFIQIVFSNPLRDAGIYHMEGGSAPEHRYAIIYEMAGDVDAILHEIQEGVASGEIHMSDCLDMSSWRLTFWNARGAKAIA